MCGEVRYRLASEPLFVHCCHCLNCQRQTGSAFVINILIEADRFETVQGKPQPVEVPRDDGTSQEIFRCGRCQTALYSWYGRPVVAFVSVARCCATGSWRSSPGRCSSCWCSSRCR